MPAEAWSVVSRYSFISNAKLVLGETSAAADAAALALDRLTVAYKENQAAARGFMAQQMRLRRSMGLTADASTKTAATVDTSYSRMATSAEASAGKMTASTGAMRREMDALAVSSSRAGNAVEAASRKGGIGRNATMIGGAVAAVTLGVGLKQAAGVQQSAAQTGVAMGIPTDQVMRQIAPVAMAMSNITAQSQAESMSLINVMATSGINKMEDLLGHNGELPMAIARFADTQFLGPHHIAFDTSARQAATLAHEFGARTGHELTPILNTLFKISQDMPDTLGQAANQIKYYGPQFVNAGVGASNILAIQATADRLGLGGGRSGTGFRQIYQSLLTPTKPQRGAQSALGMLDSKGNSRFIARNGTLDINGMFNYLNKRYDNIRRSGGDVRAFQAELAHMTTATGGSVLNLFSSDAGRKQWEAVQQTLKRVKNLNEAQEQLMATANGQMRRFGTNLQNLADVMAGPLIVPLTNFLRGAADLVGHITDFFQANPGAAHLGTGVLLAGVGAGIIAAIGTGFKIYGGFREFLPIMKNFGIVVREGAIHAGGGVGTDVVAATAARVAATTGRTGGSAYSVANLGRNIARGARGFAMGARPLAGIPAYDSLVASVAGFGVLMARFGGFATEWLGVIRFVTFGVGRAALGFVPIVGWIANLWLLADAIKWIGGHAGDIGEVWGKAVGWIEIYGGPMLASAFQHAFSAAVGAIATAANTSELLNNPIQWLLDRAKDAQAGADRGYASVQAQKAAADLARQRHQDNLLATRTRNAVPHAQITRDLNNPAAVGTGKGDVHIGGNLVVSFPNVTNPSQVGPTVKSLQSSLSVGGTNSRSTPKAPRVLGKPVGAW